ncbi:transglutaminase family protein [Algoriphagus oliviformis]|uniref:transglutaminase family protein n=1 Tax=Algoriphagus oliviformis TaxID=2811231 RepID=UPI001F4338B3|nr:transglutaminase family protein [Algoriphagus oliviformis]
MLIQVSHQSKYEYSSEVFLGIHKLYLIPQHRPYFRIEFQKFEVCPAPDGNSFRQDLAGNWYKQCWFTGQTSALQISGEWIFKLQNFNPFDFILDREFEEKGWKNPSFQFGYEDKTAFLIPFIAENGPGIFQEFLLETKNQSAGLVDFLVKITKEINQGWKHIIRPEQNIWTAELTFSKKEGSCRDLAVMQMEMLRGLGLATRFVSGYAFNPDLREGHELHAWLEVFLPGAGWLGLDPSLGLFTDHRYIPLASHPDPARAMPVQGTFLGDSGSALKTHVDMRLLHQGR